MLFDVLIVTLLASIGTCSTLPPPKALGHVPRGPVYLPAPLIPSELAIRDTGILQERAQSSEVFDIGFQLKNEEIYAGSWDFKPPKPIPIAVVPGTPIPITVEPKESIAFTLNCNDCRTYGEIAADLDTDDGLAVILTFNRAGAYLDFGVSASNTLTATFALGTFLSTGNLTSKAFEAKIGLGLNLVLSFTTAIDMTGGFQLCIPDGAQLGFDIDVGVDPATGLLAASAEVKTFPSISFSLLPFAVSSSAVNITAALVLKAEAGITTTIGPVSGTTGAGASLTIVEVNLGATTSNQPGQCSRALFAGIESNAGAFANVGLAFNNDSVLDDQPNVNVSTVFATAGTTACLGTETPSIPTFAPSHPSDMVGCPVSPVTQFTTITKTNSLTQCLVPLVNCPTSLTQLVVQSKEEAFTTTYCPTPSATTSASNMTAAHYGHGNSSYYATGTGYYYPSSPTTTTNIPISGSLLPPGSSSVTAAPVASACATGIELSKLVSLVTVPLAQEFQTLTAAENATITGSPQISTTLPPVAGTVGIVTAGAGRVSAAVTMSVLMMVGRLVVFLF
ncbi:hypothetical protein B0H66DRAFT_613639 [Apodospora peruviana]|uniref:Uncharacterized protein n=1 Tax=Apodospora peruviana TaxID=516989 RepID=A0AAE0MGH5_9PEZI|nr:hypothetical protein B0H66DRAFT_613639 [Apodospora peruviana]